MAIIENGTRDDQKIIKGALGDVPALIDAGEINGPALIVVGEVAALADGETLRSLTQNQRRGRMKAVTANRLADGAVVYLGDDDQWTPYLVEAARFEDADAAPVLAAAQGRVTEIADAYLIDVDGPGDRLAPAGRQALRETIRTNGPTVRTDLGYQAEARSCPAN